MQFSLRILLAFVLLVSLILCGWVFDQRLVESKIRSDFLRLQVSELSNQVGDFEQQKVQHGRFMAAEAKRVREFSKAEEKFREVASKYGKLEVKDPEKLAIVAVPDWDLADVDRHTWRIFVPADQELALAVDFLGPNELPVFITNDDGSQLRQFSVGRWDPKVLETASQYDPGIPWTMALPAGESELSFHWISNEHPHLAKLFFNGKQVKEFRFLESATGRSSTAGKFKDQVEFDPSKTVNVFSIAPDVDTAGFHETMRLRILRIDRKANQ